MRFAQSQIICWSALVLLLLSGCASSPAQRSPTHAGTSPTPTFLLTPTNIVLPTPTEIVVSYQPNDHDPFQANFFERGLVTGCPPTSKRTDLCFNVSGSGSSIPYGPISFSSFDINFLAPGKGPIRDYSHDPGYCEPTTRQGSITIGADMVLFTSSGTSCYYLVHFAYQVTGGTGTFRHAHGTGSIDIPNPTNNIVEYWTGTLTP
jgi:hypothetical protein